MESQEFHDQLQPFLSNNTTQFIRELMSFASSPYDMRGYDDKVVYDMPPVALSTGKFQSSMIFKELKNLFVL